MTYQRIPSGIGDKQQANNFSNYLPKRTTHHSSHRHQQATAVLSRTADRVSTPAKLSIHLICSVIFVQKLLSYCDDVTGYHLLLANYVDIIIRNIMPCCFWHQYSNSQSCVCVCVCVNRNENLSFCVLKNRVYRFDTAVKWNNIPFFKTMFLQSLVSFSFTNLLVTQCALV